MDYAIEMLIPIVGALFLGMWLQNNHGTSPMLTVILAILGMVAGIWIVAKRARERAATEKQNHDEIPKKPLPFKPRPWEDNEEEDDDKLI